MPKIEMTRQKMFNIAGLHLLKQGKRSENEGASLCMYRGPEGTMCAVGCLIPDELYDQKMEGSDPYYLVNLFDLFKIEDAGFLKSLQKIHDKSTNAPTTWALHLYETSKTYDLNWFEFTEYVWENGRINLPNF